MTPLEIVVKGNVDGAKTSLQTVQAELGKTVIAAQKTDSSLQVMSKSGGQSVFNLTEKLRALNSAVFTEKSSSQIKLFNSQIQATEKEIAQLSNVGKEGFDKLGNAVKSTGNPLAQAFSGIRKIAYILPGIGIAGIFNLAFEGLSTFVSALSDAENGLSATAKAQKALNLAMADARGSVAGEVVELQSLFSIAKNTSLSYEARTQAIKALNKEYPALHGNLSLENINTAAITATINHEIEAIKRRSQAKAIEKLIDDESIKLEEAKLKAGSRSTSSFQSFINTVQSGLGVPGLLSTTAGEAELLGREMEDAQAKIELFSKKLNELNTESAKAGTLIIIPPGSEKEVETIKDVLTKLGIQIEFLNQKELTLKTDEANAKIAAIESAIDHLLQKFRLTSANPIIINLVARIQDIQLTEQFNKILKGGGDKQKIIIPEEIQVEMQKPTIDFPPGTFDEQILRDDILAKLAALGINKTIPIKIGVDVSGVDINAGSEGVGKNTPIDKLKATLKEAEKELQSFNDKISKEFSAVLVDAISGVGQDIGKALAGSINGEQIFGDLFKVIGSGLQMFGKALIEYGIGIKAIKLAKLNPALAIAAGFGLEIFGAFIEAAIPKFASGVTNFGGGVALVGERGPELVTLPRGSNVIPNNQISGSGGGTQVFIPQITLRGADMIVMFQRATQQASRNG